MDEKRNHETEKQTARSFTESEQSCGAGKSARRDAPKRAPRKPLAAICAMLAALTLCGASSASVTGSAGGSAAQNETSVTVAQSESVDAAAQNESSGEAAQDQPPESEARRDSGASAALREFANSPDSGAAGDAGQSGQTALSKESKLDSKKIGAHRANGTLRGATEKKPVPQAVTVIAPNGRFAGETRFEDGVTLVDAVEFARFAGADEVTCDGASIRAAGGGFDVTVSEDAEYIISSGRCFWTRRTISFEGNTSFVPISPLAAAFGFDAEGDGDFTVRLSGGGEIEPAESYYDSDDLLWLSHIINAESGCEPFAGKVAVGNVVLNRVRSEQYPDTVYGVVFDRRFGVQFSPTENGTIYLEPSADSLAAAKVCLEGYSLSGEIAFFFNPAIAESTWISENRPWIMTIGNHAFYS